MAIFPSIFQIHKTGRNIIPYYLSHVLKQEYDVNGVFHRAAYSQAQCGFAGFGRFCSHIGICKTLERFYEMKIPIYSFPFRYPFDGLCALPTFLRLLSKEDTKPTFPSVTECSFFILGFMLAQTLRSSALRINFWEVLQKTLVIPAVSDQYNDLFVFASEVFLVGGSL